MWSTHIDDFALKLRNTVVDHGANLRTSTLPVTNSEDIRATLERRARYVCETFPEPEDGSWLPRSNACEAKRPDREGVSSET